MRLSITVSAIAFDLDGTLVHTLPDLHEASNLTLRELGMDEVGEDAIKLFIGDGIDCLIRRILARQFDGEIDSSFWTRARKIFMKYYGMVLATKSYPFPEVQLTLTDLRQRGFKVSCVTNKSERFTKSLLSKHGLSNSFDLILGGDTLSKKKPHPKQLRYCANYFGISTKHLLMIGDSANDTRAARSAGCPVLFASYGYEEGNLKLKLDYDAILEKISDLYKFINPVPFAGTIAD